MKNSKKILAFLLSTFMVCAVPTAFSACQKVEEEPPKVEQPTEPSKVKDGTDISIAVGASSTITVSDYITANGKTVTVQSSNPAVASAELKNGVVTILGKAKGTAIIKLICESVEVSFNLTVTEEVKITPAPVFDNVNASIDLRSDTYAEVDLAPKSGGDNFNLVYTLANSLISGAEITGNKLKFTPEETGKYEITIAVKCTEKDNAENVYNLTFKVTVTVTESQEETVYYKVTVDGTETRVEEGKTFVLPEFTGTAPEGKEFKCWKIGEEEKAQGAEITVTGNVTITSVFKTKEYTVTIDGEAQTVEHGTAFVLPEFTGTVPEGKEFKCWKIGEEEKAQGAEITVTGNVTITSVFKIKEYTVTIDGEAQTVAHGTIITLPADKQVEEGKQFMGWTDGTNSYTAGSDVTVTGNLTITAIIEDIPDTPPVLVKDSDNVELVLDSDSDSATIHISDYIETNGYAVKVENSNHNAVSVNSSLTDITVSAVEFGSATITVTCGNITVTITVSVKYPPSEVKHEVVTDTQVHDLFAGDLILNLAENITYNAQVTGYKVNGVDVEGSTFKVTGNFTQTEQEVTFTVTALFDDADPLVYTYKVNVIDTTAYRIVNGSFDEWENGKPVGWTVTDGYGSEQTAPTYWDNPERDFDNIGSYFGDTDEGKTGTLQTNTFIVGNSGWVSFQLGSAHPDASIWVEIFDVTQNKTIAKFKNEKWSDPDNAQRLIPYKVDLSDYIGDSVYIKIVDDESNGSMGFKTFFADSFNSWHDDEPTAITVDNGEERTYIQLGSPVFADLTSSVDLKDGNQAQITLPEAVYGVFGLHYTFTTEAEGASIEDGKIIFEAVKAGVYEITVAGETKYGSSEFKVTVTVINTKVRPEVGNANLGQINIDTENLTVTKSLTEGNENFEVSYQLKTAVDGASIQDNKFTYTATAGQNKGTVEVTLVVTFTDKVYPQDTYTKEITLSVEIVGNAPEIKEKTVTAEYDLASNDSVEVELNLAENVTIPASVTVTYSVNNEEVEGSVYRETLNKGTHELTVKIHYGDNEEIEYKYIVKVAQYSLVNGDFETGDLTGWEFIVADESTDFGRVENADYYWNDSKKIFNKQGEWLFTGVETTPDTNQEAGKGTLKSSTFTLKQNGWISFLMGGAHNIYCGVRVRTADGTILAEFNNQNKGFEAVMDRYIYHFTGMSEDIDCYIEVFDNATATGNWGLVVVDDFKTDWGSTRPEYEDAKEIVPVYVKGQTQVYNGTFDNGDLGWDIVTTFDDGGAFASVNTSGENVYFVWDENENSYNNDGNFLQNMSEKSKGYALSSAFEVSENGWMTFKLGGNNANCYVAIVDADTGEELARFVNKNFVGAFPTRGWEMYSYKVNLIDSGIEAGTRVRIKVVDDATEDYGVVVADSFITDYNAEPDGDFVKINKVN